MLAVDPAIELMFRILAGLFVAVAAFLRSGRNS
jgi:hypothetical protein